MQHLDTVKNILKNVLSLNDDFVRDSNASTNLLGAIPQFDSMAVVSVITVLEDEFDIFIEDDEISGEVFETIGSLTKFVDSKTL